MNEVNITVNKDVLLLEGKINFENVVGVLAEGLKNITLLNTIKVDLKNLTDSDSSGLALFSAWVRSATLQKKKITFLNVPQYIQDITRVYGLDSILPLSWEN